MKKAYVCSRNLRRPIVGSGFSPLWPVLDDYCGDNPPLRVSEFLTQWLVKGRFSVYKKII